MRTNVGTSDRVARLVLAGLGVWLAAVLGFGTVGGVVVLVVAAVLAVTAVVGYCPLYAALRVSTRRGRHGVAAGR